MEVGGKRWPTQRCAGPAAAQDNTIINRIMLRFRPIAPKPLPDGSVTGSFPGDNKAEMVTKPRAKRKYVRVKKNRKCKLNKEHDDVEKRDLNFNDGGDGGGAVVTLGQMEEEEEEEDMARSIKFFPGIMGTSTTTRTTFSERLMSFSMKEKSRMISMKLDESDRSRAVVESWVVVEGMSETSWLDVGILGSTDRERMQNLEVDTCPGLISDSLHRVQWVNLAYKKMVMMNGQEENNNNNNINSNNNNNGNNNNNNNSISSGAGREVVVWLVVKENKPVIWPVFACTVRVVYTCRKEKHSQTMPCDVWKMDFGGFAWRLDAKAALSLGRPISC